MKYQDIHKQARNLILYGEKETELQRSLDTYVDSGELSMPSEAFECAYRAGYEISNMSKRVAEAVYDFIGNYGDGCRDNTVSELISLAKKEYSLK